ncbi:sulfotransferase family protein [Promicromonospora sp. AC04]|uniref:sulfotransferase family protein n=1 Tax=Promicromonospora sp. AC04 TaxID=2135723 RepID=UPI000D3C5DBA|nr:sulfotransferase [Promicromonospora sp. AC04]PUB32566.1 sulfotransferase family protein [Promicromonospora sp. AC04]
MSRTPRTTRILNTALAPFVTGYRDPAGSWAKAVAQVEKEAGAQDRPFADDLGRILEGAAEIPGLSPLGWFLISNEVKGKYANRLRVGRVLAEHPQVADEPITAPVFVCGLPRTATTLAHRVLAESPDHRGPLTWELQHTMLHDPRTERKVIKQLQQGLSLMELFAPGLQEKHPMYIDRPEESVLFFAHGVHWLLQRGPMPSYSAWLADYDVLAEYEFLKLGLQVLQHGREPKRWVLKYPGHLSDMDTIRHVFPDATFVWTHRDPVTVIGSCASLLETLQGMVQHEVDPEVVGRTVLDHLVNQVNDGLQTRMNLPPSSIVDVPYHKLSADPFTEVPRLYAAIGARWTTRDQKTLAEVIAKPKGAPSHQYDLSRYVDRAEAEAAFAPYNRMLDRLDLRDATPAIEL